MPTLKQLREERGKLNAKFREVVDRAETENRDLNAEEDQLLADLNDQDLAIKRRIENLERLNDWDSELNASTGDRRRVEDLRDQDHNPARDAERQRLAFNAWARWQYGSDPNAAEREAAEALRIRPDQQSLNIALDPWDKARREAIAYRNGLTTGTPSKGGTLVRPSTAQAIEMAMLAHGTMIQEATLLDTDTGANLPFPTVNDTSNEGELVAELKATTTSDVSTGATVLSAHELSSKIIIVSQAMIEDGGDVIGLIEDVIGERLGRGMNRQATTGVGGGNAPQGVVTGATVGKTATSATAITADEVLDMIHSVDPSYRADPSMALMMHDNVVLAIRKLKDSQNQYLWQPSLISGTPDRFSNVRVVINQHMASSIAASAKTILAGPLRHYKMRRVRRITIRRMVEKYADQNADGFVGFVRFDGAIVNAGTNPIKVLQQNT